MRRRKSTDSLTGSAAKSRKVKDESLASDQTTLDALKPCRKMFDSWLQLGLHMV